MDIDKKHEHGKAVACNGVPIFDGHGGIMSVEDAERLEESWERAENYAMGKEPLDLQIASAKGRRDPSVNKGSRQLEEFSL